MTAFFALLILSISALALAKSACNVKAENFGSHHVAHVSYIAKASSANNFLFRGGSPDLAGNGQFSHHDLKSTLEYVAQQNGITLPSGFQIYDIDLMNFDQGSYDFVESSSEFNYFQQNPQDGQFFFWHTQGTQINATDNNMSTSVRQYLTRTLPTWQADMLHMRIPLLHKMLNTQYSQPVVIYIHCDCGCDRTGETAGSYYMTYMNYTWEEANNKNAMVAGRPMDCHPYLAMQWYCLYLNEQGFQLNCLNNQPCH